MPRNDLGCCVVTLVVEQAGEWVSSVDRTKAGVN